MVDTSMLSKCRYEFEAPWREDVFSKILDKSLPLCQFVYYIKFPCISIFVINIDARNLIESLSASKTKRAFEIVFSSHQFVAPIEIFTSFFNIDKMIASGLFLIIYR